VDQDRLRLRVDDREQVVNGLVSELVDGQLTFTFEGREARIPQDRIVALVLASAAGVGDPIVAPTVASPTQPSSQKGSEKTPLPPTMPLTFALTLAGDQRFTAQSWQWSTADLEATEASPPNHPAKLIDTGNRQGDALPHLHFKLVGGGEVDVAWHEVLRLDVLGGRVTYLSDLKPLAYEHRPLISSKTNWRPDASVEGRPQRIAGVSFTRGVGMPGSARLTFELQGRFETFVAEIGIDDETGRRGDAVWVVWLDDREAYRQRCRGGEAARSLRLPLNGAQRLTLAIEAGENLDLADHANWADAHLITPRPTKNP
jgi:hypothetical protein